jgi:putative sigma-54 modulation protein
MNEMKIDVHVNGIEVTDDTLTLLRQRLESELERLGRRLHRVHVHIADINGSKGGIDKLCRVVAHIRRQPALVVEDRDGDLKALIGRIGDRVGQAAGRRLDRPRNRGPRISMSGK